VREIGAEQTDPVLSGILMPLSPSLRGPALMVSLIFVHIAVL
jgi:hypothetical protein